VCKNYQNLTKLNCKYKRVQFFCRYEKHLLWQFAAWLCAYARLRCLAVAGCHFVYCVETAKDTVAIHRVPKKVSHLMIDNNFCECGSMFKILSPGDSQENSIFLSFSRGVVHTSFERIVKLGPHFPKLLSNIKWLTFLEHGVLQFAIVNSSRYVTHCIQL